MNCENGDRWKRCFNFLPFRLAAYPAERITITPTSAIPKPLPIHPKFLRTIPHIFQRNTNIELKIFFTHLVQ